MVLPRGGTVVDYRDKVTTRWGECRWGLGEDIEARNDHTRLLYVLVLRVPSEKMATYDYSLGLATEVSP